MLEKNKVIKPNHLCSLFYIYNSFIFIIITVRLVRQNRIKVKKLKSIKSYKSNEIKWIKSHKSNEIKIKLKLAKLY